MFSKYYQIFRALVTIGARSCVVRYSSSSSSLVARYFGTVRRKTTRGKGAGGRRRIDEPTAANVTMKFRYQSKVGRVGKQIQLATKELAFVHCRNGLSIFLVCLSPSMLKLGRTTRKAKISRDNDRVGKSRGFTGDGQDLVSRGLRSQTESSWLRKRGSSKTCSGRSELDLQPAHTLRWRGDSACCRPR